MKESLNYSLNYNKEIKFMYNFIKKRFINRELNNIYSNNFNKNGTNPSSVFWNSKYNQIKRFEEILDLLLSLSKKKVINIADVGCGYGAMYQFISSRKKYKNIDYQGIDINENFIRYCKKFISKNCFYLGFSSKHIVDFSIMSGTYNYTTINDINFWENYIFENLSRCLKKSKVGIIFNLQYSIPAKIINNIFYADPEKIKSRFNLNHYSFEYKKSKYFKNDLIYKVIKKI